MLKIFLIFTIFLQIQAWETPGCAKFHVAAEFDTWQSIATSQELSLAEIFALNFGVAKRFESGAKICVAHRKPGVLLPWALKVLDDKNEDLVQPYDIDSKYRKPTPKHQPGFPPI
ncbi:unnamed protein product [Caenorhabditis angaria]|uniref:LysM domain-containing protein n=1 Tax=Caenorhabditis angaria TaxID=860376 RepID=A0A9P1IG35_9PELO|nr:unnamed protein product [Caenorhabditis angaria]